MVSTVVKQKGAPSSKGGDAGETVHGRRAWSPLQYEVPLGMFVGEATDEQFGFGAQTIDDDDDFLRVVGGEDAHKALDHGRAAERDEGFGAEMPSSARREPSPAAMMANFMRKGK